MRIFSDPPHIYLFLLDFASSTIMHVLPSDIINEFALVCNFAAACLRQPGGRLADGLRKLAPHTLPVSFPNPGLAFDC